MKMLFSFFLLCFPALFWAKDLTVAFHIRFMGVLGTQVAAYDYADFNEKVLGNRSIIINSRILFDNPHHHHHLDYDPSVTKKFVDRFGENFFDVHSYEEQEEILRRENVDLFYIITGGGDLAKDVLSTHCKNAVHIVFPYNIETKADVYATISQWVADQHPELQVPVVPHIAHLHETKENLREELKIPKDAVVFGRHGALMNFDIDYVKHAVVTVAKEHKDWYFVFLFTEKFCDLPNVIFLPVTADMETKTKFINTCDAMIHARSGGETFGLCVAEFSKQNKPVITCSHHDTRLYYGKAHIEFLGNKGFYYKNREEILAHMRWIGEHIEEVRKGDWDCYSKPCGPEVVMKCFEQVFIAPFFPNNLTFRHEQ